MLQDWLARPHVAEWWTPTPTLPEMMDEFGPAIAGEGPVACFIATVEGNPIGFIQSYIPALCHDDGWWLDEHDPSVRGIDQFLADGSQLNQGIGAAMIRAFIARLFEDPTVTGIQTDPEPSNHRAIRCYEKAGFAACRTVITPDGPALLMYCARPAPGRDQAAQFWNS